MTNKNERMNKLNAMGINTNKYFTLDITSDIPAGAKLHIVVDENGDYVLAKAPEEDSIRNQIIEDGYVRNTKLFRRFVMAQMFNMLNYRSWDGRRQGYNDALKGYGYDYTIDMMIEEVRVLSKLETRDRESFKERAHFFDKAVVIAVLDDYMDKLKKYVDGLPNKNCKGIPYKRVKGKDVFVADLHKKVYWPLKHHIIHIKNNARNYTEMHRYLCAFKRDMVKLPYDTAKSKVWIDAYKGNGAYYTLKNLVMFHNCGIKVDGGYVYRGEMAVRYLAAKNIEYKGEGWRMFALMKKVIADNGINTKTYISEICNK